MSSIQRTPIHEAGQRPAVAEQPEQPAELTAETLARLEPGDWLSAQSSYWERRLSGHPATGGN